jgi:hypothetical protein
MFSQASSSSFVWIIISAGILLSLVSLAPVRHSWARRFSRMHEMFYHEDERASAQGEKEPEELTSSTPVLPARKWSYDAFNHTREAENPTSD